MCNKVNNKKIHNKKNCCLKKKLICLFVQHFFCSGLYFPEALNSHRLTIYQSVGKSGANSDMTTITLEMAAKTFKNRFPSTGSYGHF